MTGTAVVSSKRSQYPIDPNVDIELLIEDVVGFRNTNGTYELRRSLTPTERRQLEARRNLIVDNLQSARPGFVVDCVLEMLIGFGGAKLELDEAKASAAQYAAMLSGLPGWAVKRSCVRWGMGQVTEAELGEKITNRAFAPSAAQVRIIAESIIRPFVQEVARIKKTTAAEPVRKMSDAERAATADYIRTGIEQIKSKFDKTDAAEIARADEKSKAGQLEARRYNERHIMAEYTRRGIDPPPGQLVSLSTLLSMGWVIDNDGRRDVLIRPKVRTPSHQQD